MKSILALLVTSVLFLRLADSLLAQTNVFPASGDAGVGTTTPAFKLDVVGDVRATGTVIEKRLTFTPTSVGWYRIVSTSGQAGGTIRTSGAYDGGTTAVEFAYSVRGWAQGGTITQTKNSGVNGNLIDQVRVSSDGGAVYLDVHISTATSPGPIVVLGYGPGSPEFVGNPVVGAISGSSSVRLLPVGYSVGAYDDFRTTGNVVTYSADGWTPQGYIYHGPAGQAAFGNGITNGETWITRTGGAGSIKIGEYDFSVAYLTVGAWGNVGVGTTNPTGKLTVHGVGGSAFNNGVEWYSGGNPSGYYGWVGRIYSGVPSGGWATAPFIISVPDGSGNEIQTMALKGGNVGIGTLNPPAKLSVVGDQFFIKNSTAAIGTYDSHDFRILGASATGAPGKGVFIDYYNGANWYKAAQVKNVASGFGSLLLMQDGGNVGIGTTNPTNKLEVNGTIRTKEVVVESTGWSDYVFAEDYRLAPLSEIEAHIKEKKHLPGIPSAAEVADRGVNVGDMQARLLAKIEELTLHQIAQDKRIAALERENASLRVKSGTGEAPVQNQ